VGGLKPHYVRIAPGDPLPAIAQYAPFKAVFTVEVDCSNEWRNEVCDWLVGCGCRYAMAWGQNCEQWHDAVDWAELEASNFEEDDSKFIMTTWHDKETLESAFWYAQFCAMFSYDDVELNETVIIDVSLADHQAEYLALWEQSKTLAEREG
jgi:hypothetical protein